MQKQILILSIALLASTASAQAVLSAGGNEHFTLGEPIIGLLTNQNGYLTQGFHQTDQSVTGVAHFENKIFEYDLFPNPASDFVNLKSDDVWLQHVDLLHLVDALGRRYLVAHTQSSRGLFIDLSDFKQGIYSIHGYTARGQQLFSDTILLI